MKWEHLFSRDLLENKCHWSPNLDDGFPLRRYKCPHLIIWWCNSRVRPLISCLQSESTYIIHTLEEPILYLDLEVPFGHPIHVLFISIQWPWCHAQRQKFHQQIKSWIFNQKLQKVHIFPSSCLFFNTQCDRRAYSSIHRATKMGSSY